MFHYTFSWELDNNLGVFKKSRFVALKILHFTVNGREGGKCAVLGLAANVEFELAIGAFDGVILALLG